MREELTSREDRLLRRLNLDPKIELIIRATWLDQEPSRRFTSWSLVLLISPLLITCLLLNLPVFHLDLNGFVNLAVAVVWIWEIIFGMLIYPIITNAILLALDGCDFGFNLAKLLTFGTLSIYKKSLAQKLYLGLVFISLFVLLAMNGYIFTAISFCLAGIFSLAFESFYRSKIEEVFRQLNN